MSAFKKITPSVLVIILYFVAIPLMNFNHHKYARGEEGIIKYDIKSYYAYLPALFIYDDLSLDFMAEDREKFNKWIT